MEIKYNELDEQQIERIVNFFRKNGPKLLEELKSLITKHNVSELIIVKEQLYLNILSYFMFLDSLIYNHMPNSVSGGLLYSDNKKQQKQIIEQNLRVLQQNYFKFVNLEFTMLEDLFESEKTKETYRLLKNKF